MRIRDESEADVPHVDRILRDAFGGDAEARLVVALRRDVRPRVNLVAEQGGSVCGHVFCSPVRVEGESAGAPLGALAPLAVAPARQGVGVGGALVRESIARSRALGWKALFLLGDPGYYGRFGFELVASRGLHYESEHYDPGFQAFELEAGALRGERGFVRYPEAFAAL